MCVRYVPQAWLASYGCPMSPRYRSCGQACPAREEINSRIRQLMEQPATRDRAAAYDQLLREWVEACGSCRPHPLAA
jgi:hypothetical protein